MKKFLATLFACVLAAAFVPALRAADQPEAAKASPTEAAPAKADAPAESPEKVIYTAETAYAFLKTMGGNWKSEGSSGHYGKGNMQTFRVSAAGSTVINTIFPGEDSEMVSVFMRDGQDLTLTH